MTRAQQTISGGFLLASLYLACFSGIIPFPTVIQSEVIPVIPFWALVSFGSYLLFSLGWGIATFRDTEDAYRELVLEIDQAKSDLRAKGIDL